MNSGRCASSTYWSISTLLPPGSCSKRSPTESTILPSPAKPSRLCGGQRRSVEPDSDCGRRPRKCAGVARLYGLRWGLEVNLRHLKQTMGMDVLRCTTREGVLKELAIFAAVYNLVRHACRRGPCGLHCR